MEHETLLSLLRDPAHWEFEILLTLLQDVVIGLCIWPFVRKHWKHHVERDARETKDDLLSNNISRMQTWRHPVPRDRELGYHGPQNSGPVGPPPKGHLSGVTKSKRRKS